MKVFIITYSDYDEHWIVQVYLDEEKAKEELKKLTKPRRRNAGCYDIEEFEVTE